LQYNNFISKVFYIFTIIDILNIKVPSDLFVKCQLFEKHF